MKTFIINEVRFNEKNEAFEVETKVQFESIDVLLRYLRDNPKTLWNGKYAIKEEKTNWIARKRHEGSSSLPYGEEIYREDD